MRVGILGSGQLARMLAVEAGRLGLSPVVFGQSVDEPACQVTSSQLIGSFDDYLALNQFFDLTDLVIFENEFIPFTDLRRAIGTKEVNFYPSLATMESFSDKCQQKRVLSTLGIPTARTLFYDESIGLDHWIVDALGEFPRGIVFKWGQRGYDGKGVLIGKRNPQVIHSFLSEGLHRGASVYAEEMIAFERELAVIGCYSITGEFSSYPLVVSVQEGGICKLVKGPASILGVSAEVERKISESVETLARASGLVGCFGIEYFETSDGQILVNEIAPRVHNSGHYTQDACKTSQFENHLRAVCGMPLGSVECSPAFAMLNLLGPAGVTTPKNITPIPSAQVSLHWYGKSGIKARRKLGHLNATGARAEDLLRIIEELYACEDNWSSRIEQEVRT